MPDCRGSAIVVIIVAAIVAVFYKRTVRRQWRYVVCLQLTHNANLKRTARMSYKDYPTTKLASTLSPFQIHSRQKLYFGSIWGHGITKRAKR